MKIIKRGIIPEEVPHRITCGYCKSELEYIKNDIKYHVGDQRDPGYDYIICPVCSKQKVVKDHNQANNSWDYFNR